MNYKLTIIAIVIGVSLFGSGCKKWRENRETLTSENHTLAESSFNDVFSYLLIAASPGGALLQDSCISIIAAGSGFPMNITIDLGAKGCQGMFRSNTYGKINMTISDSITNAGAEITAIPEGLHIKGYRVEGSVKLTFTGNNASGMPEYHYTVTNGMIIATKEETAEDFSILWQCDYHYELLDKTNEAILIDDLFQITGSATGVNTDDRNFNADIIEPLKKYMDCRWPGSGITKISPEDLKERDLNYGDCESANCCDNEAIEEAKWPDRTVRMR